MGKQGGANHERAAVHLTRQCDYGVRAVLYLASLAYGTVVQTKEIATQEDIPRKYLPSIIRTLARSGIIRTLRGNQGGVMLSRPPEEITLHEVIEAIEGPITLVQCQREPGHCSFGKKCPFLTVCEDVQNSMVSQLEGTTFADLVAGTYVEAKGSKRRPATGARRRPLGPPVAGNRPPRPGSSA